MTVLQPIARAWISTGGTGARNYDEFADDAEITEIIAANPHSALAIEMPHRAPDLVGRPFALALPEAAARLREEQTRGRYRQRDDVVVLYQIAATGQPPAYGMFAMVRTDEISTSAEEPGRVIRNEDVFLDKVRERVALAEATGHVLSPVLLLQTRDGAVLREAVEAAVADAGEPAVTDVDHVGRTHSVWPVPGDSAVARHLLDLAGAGDLVVADGNHRSLAAQIGGLPRFLAVITTAESVAIQPYHRIVSGLVARVDPAWTATGLTDALERAGASVEWVDGTPDVPPRGVIHLYGRYESTMDGENGRSLGYLRVRLDGCVAADADVVERMDHSVVERVVFGEVLGLTPEDKRVTYVGGDYPPRWLVDEVDAGRADLAVLIAAVTVDDFVDVNLARRKMPRKSTWFTPKARGGLVLADLAVVN